MIYHPFHDFYLEKSMQGRCVLVLNIIYRNNLSMNHCNIIKTTYKTYLLQVLTLIDINIYLMIYINMEHGRKFVDNIEHQIET